MGASVEDMAFIKGASDWMLENGADPNVAERSATLLCKVARTRNDDEEEESFWGRNKNWLLPTLVGIGALHVGHALGKGRPDRSALSNLWSKIFNFSLMPKDNRVPPNPNATTAAVQGPSGDRIDDSIARGGHGGQKAEDYS